jgi:hypothetical protein
MWGIVYNTYGCIVYANKLHTIFMAIKSFNILFAIQIPNDCGLILRKKDILKTLQYTSCIYTLTSEPVTKILYVLDAAMVVTTDEWPLRHSAKVKSVVAFPFLTCQIHTSFFIDKMSIKYCFSLIILTYIISATSNQGTRIREACSANKPNMHIFKYIQKLSRFCGKQPQTIIRESPFNVS